MKAVSSVNRIPEVFVARSATKTFWPLVRDYLKLPGGVHPWTFTSRMGSRIEICDWWDSTTVWAIYVRREYDVRPSDSTILDFGSNIGVFAAFASEIAPSARIFSYEPFPDTYGRLQRTVANNGWSSTIQTFCEGLGLESSTASMSLGEAASVCRRVEFQNENQGPTVVIPIVSLEQAIDRTGVEQVDFAKIDVEGAEEEILLGSEIKTLHRIRRLSVEIHSGPAIEKISKRLCGNGMRLLGRKGHAGESTLTFEYTDRL
jgi:FkbM family methyltransferase